MHLKDYGCWAAIAVCLWSNPGMAQVLPDQTLAPQERSQVTIADSILITGGAKRGSNLFHSFSEFSLLAGEMALFQSDPSVQRIFARVTGEQMSIIEGQIRSDSRADLVLINPNGISFGNQASLRIGGSFLATTAESILFADGSQFQARGLENAAPPLLTVSLPVGLQLGGNPGSISVASGGSSYQLRSPIVNPLSRQPSGDNSAETVPGLRVQPGKTLALVAGHLSFFGGILIAEQGRIELGSLQQGQVNLDLSGSTWALSYPTGSSFGAIQLSQRSLLDASGAGSIQLQGREITLFDHSLIVIQNHQSQRGGKIMIQATDLLNLDGQIMSATIGYDRGVIDLDALGWIPDPPITQQYNGILSENLGDGLGADIAIVAGNISISNGATILATTHGTGNSGNLQVQVQDRLTLSGSAPSESGISSGMSSSLAAATFGSGQAGSVNVQTRSLLLEGGGVLGSTSYSHGNAGNVRIHASDSVQLIGSSDRLLSNIFSLTAGAGNAGTLHLSTRNLELMDGGTVSASSYGLGNAGRILLDVRDAIVLSSTKSVAPLASGIDAAVEWRFAQSGDILIRTGAFKISNGALISVSNGGIGNGGQLTVQANTLELRDRSSLTANARFGRGGNINLQIRDRILLRKGSYIATSAQAQNGGDITIKTDLLIAVPSQNSDIRADSNQAQGGNIMIDTKALLGLKLQPRATLESDITASGGDLSLNGGVQLTREQEPFSREWVTRPPEQEDEDASQQMTQRCRRSTDNSFVITGRGGLPPTPQQALSQADLWTATAIEPLIAGKVETGKVDRAEAAEAILSTTPQLADSPLQEATRLVQRSGGEVALVGASESQAAARPVVHCNLQSHLQQHL
jgi:filamentous hemagglutinin family protein